MKKWKRHIVKASAWKGVEGMSRGWGNGYVTIPAESWLTKYNYNEINDLLYDRLEFCVHGGLTYGEFKGKDLVVGFDTAHYSDNIKKWPLSSVKKETTRLRDALMRLHMTKK